MTRSAIEWKKLLVVLLVFIAALVLGVMSDFVAEEAAVGLGVIGMLGFVVGWIMRGQLSEDPAPQAREIRDDRYR